ncbi:MAG TPA: hypothetical protein VGR11_08095 [Solirubrobacteraceae bacterium]|nr:hypothetical protein [Solirubrobacteraceae bacterium]
MANTFIARLLSVPVLDVTAAFRVLVLVLPLLVGVIAYRVLRGLAATGPSGPPTFPRGRSCAAGHDHIQREPSRPTKEER